ncbi:hypothetical protein CapIbe_011333 [Capra ibex]
MHASDWIPYDIALYVDFLKRRVFNKLKPIIDSEILSAESELRTTGNTEVRSKPGEEREAERLKTCPRSQLVNVGVEFEFRSAAAENPGVKPGPTFLLIWGQTRLMLPSPKLEGKTLCCPSVSWHRQPQLQKFQDL